MHPPGRCETATTSLCESGPPSLRTSALRSFASQRLPTSAPPHPFPPNSMLGLLFEGRPNGKKDCAPRRFAAARPATLNSGGGVRTCGSKHRWTCTDGHGPSRMNGYCTTYSFKMARPALHNFFFRQQYPFIAVNNLRERWARVCVLWAGGPPSALHFPPTAFFASAHQ